MSKYKIPDVPETYRYMLTNLLGVDYNDTIVDDRRSPRMENLLNNNGFLESRHGISKLLHIGDAPIYNVWNCDGNGDEFIVHIGTNIYRVDNTFSTITLLKSGVNDAQSDGVVFQNELYIFDGLRALIYHPVTDEQTQITTWQVDYLDTCGYIPTTSISRNPDGQVSTAYETANQLTTRRVNLFLGDGTSTNYQLDGSAWLDTSIKVRIFQNGHFEDMTSGYTYDYTTGVVTFTTAPSFSPVAGQDNVEITFDCASTTSKEAIVNYINKCNICTTYGYGGNNNRIFVTGNPDIPNCDWWCASEKGLMFPVDNVARIGNLSVPIIGYSRLTDGTLAIQKDISDSDSTVFYRTYNQFNGEDVFPLTAGVKNIGCITHRCSCNFLNDPVFLTRNGIYSITTQNSNNTDEKFAEEKSYYIKNKLINEENLENAVAIVLNTRYYLAINGHIYVADKRFISNTTYGDSAYQYEWFYLTGIDVNTFFTYNNKLYWGTSHGDIYTFGDEYEDTLYDETQEEYIVKPVDIYWETPYIYFDNYADAKTVRKVFLHHNPIGASTINLYYIDNDGEHFISTSNYNGSDTYPKVIQEKEKISKVMCCKFAVKSSEPTRCSFNTLLCEYRIAGKYRGE